MIKSEKFEVHADSKKNETQPNVTKVGRWKHNITKHKYSAFKRTEYGNFDCNCVRGAHTPIYAKYDTTSTQLKTLYSPVIIYVRCISGCFYGRY